MLMQCLPPWRAVLLAALTSLLACGPGEVSPAPHSDEELPTLAPLSNGLQNGDFEQGLSGWSVPSWYASELGVDAVSVRSGAASLHFDGGQSPILYQDLVAEPGQVLTLAGWARVPAASGSTTLAVDLVPRHVYNGTLATVSVARVAASNAGWVAFSGTATMPANTAQVRVQVRAVNLRGQAFLDGLTLSGTLSPTPQPDAGAPPPPPPDAGAPPPPPAPPPPSGGPLANTPWPTWGQNTSYTHRSPYSGPRTKPSLRWSFARFNDHWGTDYRGVGIGGDGTVYLAAGMTGIYAIDRSSGGMKWLFSPENTGHETWVEFAPTFASDGTLYVSSENDYLYALDRDGKVLWKFRSDHLHVPVSLSPDGRSVHFISESGHIYALDRLTGAQQWRYQLGPGRAYGTGRRIPVNYDAQGNLYFGWVDTIWSLTADGQKRWSLSPGLAGFHLAGPAASGQTLYFTYQTSVLAVDRDGTLKWKFPLAKSAFDRVPAVGADGTVYIGAEDGFIYAIHPDGTLKWKQQYVQTGGWGGGIKSNLLIDAQGILYFLSKDQSVVAVDSATRAVLWSVPTGNEDLSYPGQELALDSDGTLYVPIDEGILWALGGSGATPPPPPPPPADAGTADPDAGTPPPPPNGSILYGAWVGSAVNVAGDEAAFEQATGKPRAVRHWYWSVSPLATDASRFSAWSSSMPANTALMLSFAPSPTDSRLERVNAGEHDAYIVSWARALKAYQREVWLRPMWEDNGSWYWWSSGRDFETARKDQYKQAFQRIVRLFRQEGATNVKFIWCPNVRGSGAGDPMLSYPGADFVDWVGLDGYPMRGGRGDFYATFKTDYDALGTLNKPMMVCETAINIYSDTDRAAFVTRVLTYEMPTRFPSFRALVWFSEPGFGDLLDPAYPKTLAAFKAGIAGSYYRGR